MNGALFIAALGTGLAFLLGWAVGQGSTCAVTAAKEIVHQRSARLLTGFVLAGAVAGLISLPLAWTLGMRAGLPPEAPLGAALATGAVLLASGALVNDACLFGTLGRIAQGELRFLAVPAGLFLGFIAAALVAPGRAPLTPNAFGHFAPAGAALVAVSAVLAPLAWWGLRRTPHPPGSWPLQHAMLLLGGAGSLLFVLTPGWTYADAVRRVALAATGGGRAAMLPAVVAGLATIAGAVLAGVRSGRFRWRAPSGTGVLRSLAGGALMATGAWVVPGGNDSLLLWAVPGGSVSGLLAYATMSGLVLAVIALRHHAVDGALVARVFRRG